MRLQSQRDGSKFCSCCGRRFLQKKKVSKSCLVCGKMFTRNSYPPERSKYCSRSCRAKAAILRKASVVKNCIQCGVSFKLVGRGKVNQDKQRFCSQTCVYASRRKPKKINSGYVQVYVPIGTPGAKKNGRMWEHRYVMQNYLKRPLLSYEVVHHINSDRKDNRIENLELVSPQLNTAYALQKGV